VSGEPGPIDLRERVLAVTGQEVMTKDRVTLRLNLSATFRVKGDAPKEKLREVVERAQKRSAVFDMVTNGVPVAVEVETP